VAVPRRCFPISGSVKFSGFASIFRSAKTRSAARKYARQLGPRLGRDYGASKYYTPGQIRAAVAACHLPEQYLSFGYAAFLSEDAFLASTADGDYHDLRKLLFRYVRSNVAQTFEPQPESWIALSGYDSSHDG
jgi:hypothetical protein